MKKFQKRIIEKVIKRLEELPTTDVSWDTRALLSFLKEGNSLFAPSILNNYENTIRVLSFCDLSLSEQGYLFSFVLEECIRLVKTHPFYFINTDKYQAQIHNFTLDDEEFLNVVDHLQLKKENNEIKVSGVILPKYFSSIQLAEQFIKDLFNSNENTFKKGFYVNGRFIEDYRKKWSEEIKEKVKPLKEKSFKEICTTLATKLQSSNDILEYMKQNDSVPRIIGAYMMTSYAKDTNFTSFYSLFTHIALTNITNIVQTEWDYLEKEWNFYQEMEKYVYQSYKNKDYEEWENKMLELLPKYIVDAVMIYSKEMDASLKEQERMKPMKMETPVIKEKKVVKEESISKKQLKKKLKQYSEMPFDYENLEDVISILKSLNFEDSHVMDVFYNLERNALHNLEYYLHMYSKLKFYEPSSETLNLMASHLIDIEGTKEVENDYLEGYIKTHLVPLTTDYEYELKLVNKENTKD